MSSSTERNAVRVCIERPCTNCDGEGIIPDPEHFGYAEALQLNDEEWQAFLHDKGMSELDPLPPEEGDCPDCEGGYGRETVTLAEFAELLAKEPR